MKLIIILLDKQSNLEGEEINAEEMYKQNSSMTSIEASNWSATVAQTIFRGLDNDEDEINATDCDFEIDEEKISSPLKTVLSSEELHDSLEEPLHLPEALFKGVDKSGV